MSPDPKTAWRTLLARAQGRVAERSARAALARQRAALLAATCLSHGARKVILFGSLATGQCRVGDVDLAVEGVPGESYFRLLGLLLEQARPFSVDLVRIEDAPESLRQRILSEGEVLVDRR